MLGSLLCILSSSTSDEVPAIAISCGDTPLLSLHKYQPSMDTLEFKKLVSLLWDENTKVIVILENELSFEDFSMKDTDGHSVFQSFENNNDVRFFPSVDQPEKAIKMLSKNGFSIKAYNKDTYTSSSDKIIALNYFNENNSNDEIDSRQTMLRKHNTLISKMFNNLCTKYTNVVLLLSGKLNPWIVKTKGSNSHHLVTRQLMAQDIDNKSAKLKILDPKGKSLIYSPSYPTLSVNNGPETELKASNSDVYLDDGRENFLKVGTIFLANDTKITLRFRFDKTTFTWELKTIEYEYLDSIVHLTPKQPITAQLGLSYFSEGPVIFSNNLTVLKFNDKFQVQPWLTSSLGNSKFSDPQEQDSFFTPPILAGLFVTALMLFIVTWGITMIMDIKTMDRFDDPKGKTISINVAE